jgi:hypothetical protein
MREIVFSMRLTKEEHDAWIKLAQGERRSLVDIVRLTMEDRVKDYHVASTRGILSDPVASDQTISRRKAQQLVAE